MVVRDTYYCNGCAANLATKTLSLIAVVAAKGNKQKPQVYHITFLYLKMCLSLYGNVSGICESCCDDQKDESDGFNLSGLHFLEEKH